MKKVLLFSAVLVLFCLAALLPANASAGSLSFDKMRFFESNFNLTEYSQRIYANRFPKSATRYINTEVNFFNLNRVTNESHRLILKYYSPDGSVFGETGYTGITESIWSTYWMSASLGWETPGNYSVGQYRVEAYLDGNYVTTGYFEIYDDKTAYNQKNSVKSEDIVKDWDQAIESGNKIYDLYYDKKIIKTPSGNILLNVFLDYTDWGREKYLKNIPNAKTLGMILEVNVNLNQYRVLLEAHSDSKGIILYEKKYDNPQWLIPKEGTMAERWMEIARELSR